MRDRFQQESPRSQKIIMIGGLVIALVCAVVTLNVLIPNQVAVETPSVTQESLPPPAPSEPTDEPAPAIMGAPVGEQPPDITGQGAGAQADPAQGKFDIQIMLTQSTTYSVDPIGDDTGRRFSPSIIQILNNGGQPVIDENGDVRTRPPQAGAVFLIMCRWDELENKQSSNWYRAQLISDPGLPSEHLPTEGSFGHIFLPEAHNGSSTVLRREDDIIGMMWCSDYDAMVAAR